MILLVFLNLLLEIQVNSLSLFIYNICQLLIGIIGGKFLERGKISKPKASPSDPTVYYQAEVKRHVYLYNKTLK